MNEQTSTKPKAYNVNMTVDSIETPTSSTGKEYIRAKVTAELRGKQRPRTLVAMQGGRSHPRRTGRRRDRQDPRHLQQVRERRRRRRR